MKFVRRLPQLATLLNLGTLCFVMLAGSTALASEADLAIPDLRQGEFHFGDATITAWKLLFYGAWVIVGTLSISLYLRASIKRLPAHESMLNIAEIIFQTCKTYLIQQGKFLIMLFILIGGAMAYYFMALQSETVNTTAIVLLFSIVGMIGSYWVAWYGIRVNTYANARTAFASLRGEPLDVVNIPLKAGMSIGLFLISLELVMMVIILLFVPREIVGYCFLGFAIGESLGASALRIAGGIFTKIADIGSDLMKIVFNVKEDDPRNPGVIADCTGDNAGDSVGPTADGFETYGVTGVALITFITLAIPATHADLQAKLIVWIFAMRFLMDFMSGVSYFINQRISEVKYRGKKEFDFEAPLTRLIWIASILCISTSFGMSWLLIRDLQVPGVSEAITGQLWWQLATIISCGTLAAVLIPEFTKVFTSSHSKHVHEIVTASREGGTSLTILSGLVAGYFSAFWKGMLIAGLMAGAFFVSREGLDRVMQVQLTSARSYTLEHDESIKADTRQQIEKELREDQARIEQKAAEAAHEAQKASETGSTAVTSPAPAVVEVAQSATLDGLEVTIRDRIKIELGQKNLVGVGSIFAFGLVAFGFLCMGPVNIAVDSYGPVTDNAQSIFELAQTESIPGVKEQIKREFGFEPDFHQGKHYLEANDSAGNTFKATAKPVLIGTAVVGATTMIFAIILLLGKKGLLHLSLTDAPVLLGFICGGSVIFWFCGASMQAVTTGAYRAVEFIKKNFNLNKTSADIEDSKTVVRICTQYAQAGMWNIFITLMALTLAFAFFDPNFFVAYLVSIAIFGLFQAIFMANAGGSWDNAKKLVEVDLKEKGTDLHAATVVGDTVGDPFKDTTSVALNPIIKFSTLFGLLAVEIAVKMKQTAISKGTFDYTTVIGAVMLLIGFVFVWRSFYAMRIPDVPEAAKSH
ncbi:MAG: sodium/proton-translocating pyrophosphatase [Pirellulales bacterium]|nr:sodium/proton-translocating pyrophosphatase [Pirellulales bacterium]